MGDTSDFNLLNPFVIFYRFKEFSKKSRSDPIATLSYPSPFPATRKVFLMSIEDKRNQLIEELIPFEDHLERLTYVIDRAKDNPGLEEEYKIETFLIKGCVSQLWVFPSFADGKCHFQADSEASITKGTATLLCDLYSDESPKDIVGWSPTSSRGGYHTVTNRRMDLPASAKRSKHGSNEAQSRLLKIFFSEKIISHTRSRSL